MTNSLVRREWKFVSTFWALSHVAMDHRRTAGAGGGSSVSYVKREVAVRAFDKSFGFFAHSKHPQTEPTIHTLKNFLDLSHSRISMFTTQEQARHVVEKWKISLQSTR